MFTESPLSIINDAVGDLGKIIPGDHDAASIRNRRILDAVQTVANVLVTTGVRYSVRVAPDNDPNIASTDLVGAKIVVTSSPLRDPNLSAAEAATIMTAFIVHEIAHANHTPPLRAAQNERWPGKKLPKKIGNIYDDGNIEQKACRRFPGIPLDIFDVALEWVGKADLEAAGPQAWPATGTVAERVNFLSAATRYRKVSTLQWATDPLTTENRRFFGALYESITPDTTTDMMISIIEQAMDRIRDGAAKDEPQPEGPGPNTTVCPPIIDLPPTPPPVEDDMDEEPPNTEGGEEPTDEEPPKGEGKGEGKGDEPGEDTDEEPKGSTEGGDDPTEDEPPKGDSPGGDDDGEDPKGDDGTDGGDDPVDGPANDGTEGEHKDENPDPKGGQVLGGHGSDSTDEYDSDVDLGFDPEGVKQDMDDLIERVDPWGQNVQRGIDIERSSLRLSDKEFGHMKVVIQ